MDDIVDALRANIKNPLPSAPECVVVMPELLQMAIDEIERLRSDLRRCMPGTEIVKLGQESISLYLRNH